VRGQEGKGENVQNGESKRLPPLPPSSHRWWGEAKKFRSEMGKVRKCEHYFERKGREIKCRKGCGIGYFASPYIKIKRGKLVV
jgi:hypothetical protein